MTRMAVALAAVSTAAFLAIPASAAQFGAGNQVRLAQADVTVKTTEPVVKKKVIVKRRRPVVHEHVVVGTPAVHDRVVVGGATTTVGCKMVTTRVKEGDRTITKKVRRCP